MNRGNGLNPTCWLVSAQSAVQQFSLRTIQIDIPVRAIVAGLNRVPAPTGMVGDQLITACQSQTSPSAVSFTVFILPVQSPSTYTGTGFQQVLPVDMVGPQAPVLTNPPINPGDTFLTASWTANGDSDTIGYDVFLEQVTGIAGSAPDGAIPTVTVCNDSGAGQADAGQDADDGSASSIDSGDDSSASGDSGDATVSSDASLAFEASCRTTSVGAPPPQVSLCGTSSALSSAISSDAGSSMAPATTTDDGAVVLDDAAATPSGPGGVATIDCSFLIGGNCSAGQPAYTSTSITLSGKANNSSIIKDLTDGVKYNYTVAAVDAFGNPGPPATVQCGTPAKVNDFFTIYRESGGRGGGGFCALDVVGEHSETSLGLAGLGLGAALVARRRRSRRS
jgi:hypothetical protein